MRTSRFSRLEEWKRLNLRSINGRLLNWKDIKRWKVLRKEFQQTGSERVVVSKTVESD